MRISREIEARYHDSQQKGLWSVLATVVKTAGSTYRKVGAKMFIDEDGALTGMIGGGCYDQAIATIAAAVNNSKTPLIHKFDTIDDDPLFGYNTGCHGTTWVLFQPCTPELAQILDISKRTASEALGIIYRESENTVTSDACRKNLSEIIEIFPEVKAQSIEHHTASLQRKKSLTQQASEQTEILWEYLPTPLNLVIVGCGTDAVPVYQLARDMGWNTTLIDHREHFAKQKPLIDARVLIGKAQNIIGDINIDERTVVVLMSHNYEIDKETLKFLVTSDACYIGLLGARNRCERIVGEISREGTKFDKNFEDKFFAPVGLDLYSDSPETIALSIVSEISYVIYGGSKNSKRIKLRE